MDFRLESVEKIFSRIRAIESRFSAPPKPNKFREIFLEQQQQMKGNEYHQVINKYSDQFKVDPNLIKSIIKHESDFNWNAVSKKGAQGLMQLMPDTAKSLGVENPFDVDQNIRGGVEYLAKMLKKYDGDIEKALAAYNAGPTTVDKYKGVPPYKQTRDYINRVIREYELRKKTGL